MIRIGITGGIGSGKTTVIKILAGLGYPTLISDNEISKLYKTDQFLIQKLKFIIPKSYNNGMIDKEFLINHCKETDNLKQLSNLVHPYFYLYCRKWINSQKEYKICFMEIPLLFESKYQSLFSGILNIFVCRKIREKRLLLKRGINSEDAKIFLHLQSYHELCRIQMSNYNLINNKNLFFLKKNINILISNIL